MYLDQRRSPSDGRAVKNIFVLLHDRGIGSSLAPLAERWANYFTHGLFVMPQGHLQSGSSDASDAWFSGDGLNPGVKIDQASERLAGYIDSLVQEQGVDDRQVILVGFGSGASLALYCGLARKRQLGAVIGFGSDLIGFQDLQKRVVARPPVLLVHGERDEFVPPSLFLSNYGRLESVGVPMTMCFRPQIGHDIDPQGADAAMFYVQGVLAASAGQLASVPARDVELPGTDAAKGVKLVIWDLDDTLWDGTLDDVGELRLNTFRVEVIKKLNQQGIVSAICSKNDLETARRALESFGLWDEFVFPRISFVPKGDALRSLIADMRLKPKNCVFIDDNVINLAEARAVLPDLRTLNAILPECDIFLQQIVDVHAHVKKSRVEEYRSLQARVTESQEFSGDREAFLATCDIHVCLAWRADLVDFAPRIEELINRTNQLNFLKTRIEPGKTLELVSEPSVRQCLAVFAWDKFGYHGLVGFICIDISSQTILHMAFSCRVMHMGMENWLLLRALSMFPGLNSPVALPMTPSSPSWLNEASFSQSQVRDFILSEERKSVVDASRAKLRIMANCHSGVWAHFSGLREVTEIDNFPRAFIIPQVLSKAYLTDTFAPALVYDFGTDMYDDKWPVEVRSQLNGGLYEACIQEFCEFLAAAGRRILIVGHPLELPEAMLAPDLGISRERREIFTAAWRKMSEQFDCVDVVDIETLVGTQGMIDYGHFTVEASQEIAKEISRWFTGLPQSVPGISAKGLPQSSPLLGAA